MDEKKIKTGVSRVRTGGAIISSKWVLESRGLFMLKDMEMSRLFSCATRTLPMLEDPSRYRSRF